MQALFAYRIVPGFCISVRASRCFMVSDEEIKDQNLLLP